jgi:hypothetical protein
MVRNERVALSRTDEMLLTFAKAFDIAKAHKTDFVEAPSPSRNAAIPGCFFVIWGPAFRSSLRVLRVPSGVSSVHLSGHRKPQPNKQGSDPMLIIGSLGFRVCRQQLTAVQPRFGQTEALLPARQDDEAEGAEEAQANDCATTQAETL